MKLVMLFLLLNIFITISYAQKLVVALEPFTPFVTKEGKGLSIDMLREIEKVSDFTFDIKIVTYARAKHELQNGRVDILGHIPANIETPEFYQYAVELDWNILTYTDLYSLNKNLLELTQDDLTIGTTTGNADFVASFSGIDRSLFIEVSALDQLIEMLLKKRVDLIVYERASTMTMLENIPEKKIYYRTIGVSPITLAVQNNAQGIKLKGALDKVIEQLNTNHIFSKAIKFNELPDEGELLENTP